MNRFRGEMTLLDRAGDNVGASGGGGEDFGRSSPMDPGRGEARTPARAPATAGSLAEDLDDEIPF